MLSVAGVTVVPMTPILGATLGAVLAALVTFLAVRGTYAGRLADAEAARDGLRERVVDLEATLTEDAQTAATLAPLREAVQRVERQVATLERDRVEQLGQMGERLAEVSATAAALRDTTAALAGSLSASATRGSWGEAQLRRVVEHAGMLRHCDFDEQVSATNRAGARIRPDVVVRLPGGRSLVIDAKAPMRAFLDAHADGVDPQAHRRLLAEHAKALRGHVDALAGKAYWTGFAETPEMVVCFVPGDAVLAAAVTADPGLYDYAQSAKVVLSSPATLMALLRTVAYVWQQDALATHAKELLALGTTLYARLASLGAHASALGRSLTRSVEDYNAFVGSLEHRALATARQLHELGIVSSALPVVAPVEAAVRPLTSEELLARLEPDVGRPEVVLLEPPVESATRLSS